MRAARTQSPRGHPAWDDHGHGTGEGGAWDERRRREGGARGMARGEEHGTGVERALDRRETGVGGAWALEERTLRTPNMAHGQQQFWIGG